jgi:putative colanic acid biosynthesis acetyltransferase WcaF
LKQIRYVNRLTWRNLLMRLLWGIARTLLFRPTPRWALHGWRRIILRTFGAKVGVGCRIDPSARIWAPWNLDMGDYVCLGESVDLYSVDTIKIGNKVTISQRVFVCTASHDIAYLDRPLVHAPIVVCDHAWVAAEVMLHPGVTVGEGAVIAARAVLRNEAPNWTVWAGNPAREVGRRRLTNDTSEAGE